MSEMHQIQFRLGLRPRPYWGSLERSPDLIAGFKGPTSKGGGGVRKDPLYFFCGSTPMCIGASCNKLTLAVLMNQAGRSKPY